MVGKLPQEARMVIYGTSHSEKRTFFSRNSKGESLSVNSRSRSYTLVTSASADTDSGFYNDIIIVVADC